MTLRLNLGKYLEQHNISAYRVVQVSKLSPNTVYALARKPTKRIDLDTVSAVVLDIRNDPVAKILASPNDILDCKNHLRLAK